MGRLIGWFAFLAVTSTASAQGVPQGIPQEQKDAIREYHTKQILGSSQNLTTLQPDVLLYRQLLAAPKQQLDVQKHHDLDPVPSAQLFKRSDLSLGQVINLAAAASGYDVSVHPQINMNQPVKINSRPNSLTDIAEYLSRITDANFVVYPESRVVMALPKASYK